MNTPAIKAAGSLPAGAVSGEIRVLLVDDQVIVARAVERMLEPERDVRLRFCQDPTKAIQEAEAFRPTVILQDMVMPEVDGMTLVRFFRNHPRLRDIPLVVLSSKEEAATKAEAFACGANDYLVKLPDRVELVARIRYHSKAYLSLVQRNEAYAALLKSQNELAAELARASEYVLSLLPAPLTEGAITAEWCFVPSAKLGGDSLGYHWLDDRHFAAYVLDVCDHGVGSALLSVSALNVLKTESLANVDFRAPEDVLNGLNRAFPMEKNNNLFFSLWYGVFTRETDELRFEAAGHPPALLRSETDELEELHTRNLFIGAMPETTYRAGSVRIRRPCSLYVFSDGVYEVTKQDGAMWTFTEFKALLASHSTAWTTDLDGLYAHVRHINAGQVLDDDFSLLKVGFSA